MSLKQDIEPDSVHYGEEVAFVITVEDAAGDPVDLTGFDLTMSFAESAVADPFYEVEGTLIDLGVNGKAQFVIPSEDWATNDEFMQGKTVVFSVWRTDTRRVYAYGRLPLTPVVQLGA